MNVFVFVKQVPDMESLFRINDRGTGYDEEGLLFRMNSYDVHAVEEAVRLNEEHGDVATVSLSVGPSRAEQVVRRALEFGVDRGVHIRIHEEMRPDALETASLIAAFMAGKRFDLLLFGVMSEDAQRYQTGPMVAALLDLPFATSVVSQTLNHDRTGIVVERELEGGRRVVMELPLPCVLSVQSGINLPRYPSLSNKLRARKVPLEVMEADTLEKGKTSEDRVHVYLPPPPQEGIFLEGTLEEKADQVIRQIHEKTGML